MDNETIRKAIDETLSWLEFMVHRIDARHDEHNQWTEHAIAHLDNAKSELESVKAFVPLPR